VLTKLIVLHATYSRAPNGIPEIFVSEIQIVIMVTLRSDYINILVVEILAAWFLLCAVAKR